MNFHNRLKTLRESLGLTQSFMADLLNMAPNSYQRYELGTRQPKFDVFTAITDYFCISADYLLARTDDPQYLIYLTKAEEKFYNHPDTWPELIEIYKRDKTANPIHLAPVFLRSCETIRNERLRRKHEDEQKK